MTSRKTALEKFDRCLDRWLRGSYGSVEDLAREAELDKFALWQHVGESRRVPLTARQRMRVLRAMHRLLTGSGIEQRRGRTG